MKLLQNYPKVQSVLLKYRYEMIHTIQGNRIESVPFEILRIYCFKVHKIGLFKANTLYILNIFFLNLEGKNKA